MKAFIGRSFDPSDKHLINSLYEFFNSLKKSDFEYWDATEAEQERISEKVKLKIDESDFFIGIITAKKPIMPKVFWNRMFNKPTMFSTSNWTIQESGYAHGRNKLVVLIIEDIVDISINDIFGDQEKIIFNRNKLDECFVKCNQVILDTMNKIKPSLNSMNENNISAVSGNKTISKEDRGEKDDGFSVYIEFHEASNNGTLEEAKEAFDKMIKNSKDKADPYTEAEAKSLYLRSVLEKLALRSSRSAYDELKIGAKKKDCDYVRSYIEVEKTLSGIGRALELLGEYEGAFTGEALTSIELLKANLYLESNDLDSSFKIYNKVFENISVNDLRHDVLIKLADVLKKYNLNIAFLGMLELALEESPTDQTTRFKLAYAYSEANMEDLALYHYEKLIVEKTQIGSINNLGVCCDRLGFKFEATKNYRKSWDSGNTLAGANLASGFLHAGFAGEAKEILMKAQLMVEHHKNVELNLSNLATEIEGEEEKLKKLKEELPEKRNFFVRVAKRTREKSCTKTQAKCSFNGMLINLTIGDLEITGKSEMKINKKGLFGEYDEMRTVTIDAKRKADFIEIKLFDSESSLFGSTGEEGYGFIDDAGITYVVPSSLDHKTEVRKIEFLPLEKENSRFVTV